MSRSIEFDIFLSIVKFVTWRISEIHIHTHTHTIRIWRSMEFRHPRLHTVVVWWLRAFRTMFVCDIRYLCDTIISHCGVNMASNFGHTFIMLAPSARGQATRTTHSRLSGLLVWYVVRMLVWRTLNTEHGEIFMHVYESFFFVSSVCTLCKDFG